MDKFANITNINYSKYKSENINSRRSAILHKTAPMKEDIFFKGFNKVFKMDKAQSIKDIPEDANIFLFSCKSKFGLPEGREAKECILTDKGISFWNKFLNGENANVMKLKNNKVDYIHGDLSDSSVVCGLIDADNSTINQIENISHVKLKNNSVAELITGADEINVSNSKIGTATVKKVIESKGNMLADNLKGFNIITNPGDKIEKVVASFINCIEAPDTPNKYTKITNAKATMGANISQAKIKELKAKDLILKNSVVENLDAEACLEFENSVVHNFKIDTIRSLTDCKSKNFYLNGSNPVAILNGKTQIDNLYLKGSNAKFFIYPRKDWDAPADNYIKNIKVLSEFKESDTYKPRIRLQGDIDVDTVEFTKAPGLVEITGPKKPDKPITVINGYVRYNTPKEEVPKLEDIDI